MKIVGIDLGAGAGLMPAMTAHRAAWLLETRELIKLALPLAATQLAQMAILATDTIMLGHYSKEALAAGALGNTIFFLVWLLGCGVPMAVAPVIAHIQGQHGSPDDGLERRETRIAVRMGLWSVALIAAPLVLLLFFTRPILLAFGQEAGLAADAGLYASVLAIGLPFAMGFQVLRSFSTALSHAVPPMVVLVLAVLLNALADYIFIFGHFGAPRLGIAGAGLASASSNAFSFLAMLGIVLGFPALRRYRILHRLLHPHWKTFGELARLGLPIGITMVFEVALFNGAALAVGLFGLNALAAHQIALTIPSITFMVPLGIGMAATVRVGLAAGAGDAAGARRAGYAAIGLSALFMGLAGLALLVWPRLLATLWLPDIPANAEVLALAVSFLHVAAAFQLMDGIQVSASLSLRGLKDTHGPMWIAGASYWLAGAPVGLYLAFGLKMRGFGIWLGLAFGLTVAAIALTARFALLARR